MSAPKSKNEKTIRRIFDMFPPLLSWFLLTSPVWAGFLFPFIVSYFFIFFYIYFFYRTATLGINSTRGYFKIKQTNKVNWFEKLKKEKLPWETMNHVIIIPTYKEPKEILQRTLTFLAEQEFPNEKIHVCIATEDRDSKALDIAASLEKQFGDNFGNFWTTVHHLKKNEVAGKSSNLAFAGKIVKQKIESAGIDKKHLTVTSCDADVSIHPKYFALLTYQFLTTDNPYKKIWQSAILFYNNIWRVPMPVRLVHTIYSINGIAQLMTPGGNFNYSTYSLSWKLLEKSGFWDADVVPEDWHLFFKAFFAEDGDMTLESLFLPIYADAVEGQTYWGSMKAQYDQNRRWAWGVSDISYAISQFIKNRDRVSSIAFIVRLTKASEQHVLWPVNWWIITLGAAITVFLNDSFRYTTMGFYLPKIASVILTLCGIFFISVIIVDYLMKPPRPASFKKSLLPLTVIQYILLPITGFFFSALPGMDAHTRLLFGKRLEYKVTEKIAK